MEEAQEDGKCRGSEAGPGKRHPPHPHPPEKLLPNLLDLSGRTRTALLQRHLVSYQATELCDAILEGYAKSKKQFFVSGSLFLPRAPGVSSRETSFTCLAAPQEEVGIETDEDYNVTLPDL